MALRIKEMIESELTELTELTELDVRRSPVFSRKGLARLASSCMRKRANIAPTPSSPIRAQLPMTDVHARIRGRDRCARRR